MDIITIVQQNIAHWAPNRHILTNTYREINPDIILLNSHGIAQNNTIYIHNYTTHKINSSNELHDGSAILIKSNIKHKITDNFDTDILQITLDTTNMGPITSPPRTCHHAGHTFSQNRLSPPSFKHYTHTHTLRPKR